MTLFTELRRRNIFRVALLYFTASWMLLEFGALLVDYTDLPGWVYRFTFAVLLIGFPLALILSWLFEITPEGLRREKQVARQASITQQTGRRLLGLSAASVLLIVLMNLLRFVLD